ncbi:MAG: hypothetical protein ACK4GT_06605 [Pararhodobacter sp.]
MKRVRIVAIAAVALGAVVIAGTQFQKADPAADVQPVAAPLPAEVTTGSLIESAATGDALVNSTRTAPQQAPQPAGAATRPGAPSLIASVTQENVAAPAAELTSQPSTEPSIPRPVFTASMAPEPGPEPAPGLVRASVLPSVDLGSADRAADQGPAQEALRRLAEITADTAAPVADPTPLEVADPVLQAELDACAIWLVVTPAPGAMLETSVYAPCDGGGAVSLTHAGLTFDTRLGDDGQLMIQIPALTEEAGVALGFADGRVQEDQTIVPDLAALERVALQWQSPALLLLHAYEFGAGYGEAGHVHAGAPRSAGIAGQGFFTVLGDPAIPEARLAQVYSYPRGQTPRDGRVALEIEAPITEDSCGHSLTATSIALHGTTSAQIRQIRLNMPDCDGNGGFVVLPGVLPELEIALN